LLKHRGTTPPIDVHEVKRLVAGAAPGLAPDDVAVVMLPRPAPAALADRALSRLGPVTATRGSIALLRIIGAAVVLFDLALGFAVLTLWSRLRKLRTGGALEDAPERQLKRA
jgi:type III secretory pathway lipoprotein EscJ